MNPASKLPESSAYEINRAPVSSHYSFVSGSGFLVIWWCLLNKIRERRFVRWFTFLSLISVLMNLNETSWIKFLSKTLFVWEELKLTWYKLHHFKCFMSVDISLASTRSLKRVDCGAHLCDPLYDHLCSAMLNQHPSCIRNPNFGCSSNRAVVWIPCCESVRKKVKLTY